MSKSVRIMLVILLAMFLFMTLACDTPGERALKIDDGTAARRAWEIQQQEQAQKESDRIKDAAEKACEGAGCE